MRRTSSLASLALLTAVASNASAALNIDLRATSFNGGALPAGSNAHYVPVFLPRPGDVFGFDVFAVVVGTNASLADDRFVSVSGSFNSPGTNLAKVFGNLSLDVVRSTTDPDTGQVLTAGFDGAGYSIGMQQDLDGDGDLDVGGTADSADAGFWSASYLTGSPGVQAGSASPTTGGRRIGFGTFTVTSTTDGGTSSSFTILQFDGRNSPLAAVFIQDGVEVHEPSANSILPITVGAAAELPELSSILSLTAAAGSVALTRRRRGRFT